MENNLHNLNKLIDESIDINALPGKILALNHNLVLKNVLKSVGKYVGFNFNSLKRDDIIVNPGEIVWNGSSMNSETSILLKVSKYSIYNEDLLFLLETLGSKSIIHFKDFSGRSGFYQFIYFLSKLDNNGNPYYEIIIDKLQSNTNYAYQDSDLEDSVLSFFKNDYYDEIIDNINSIQFEGIKSYQTKAELDSVSPVPDNYTTAKVVNDPDSTKNGYYAVSSNAWVKDSELFENTINESNISKGVSGKAVYEHIKEVFEKRIIDAQKNAIEIIPVDFEDVVYVTNTVLLNDGSTISSSFHKTTNYLYNSHISSYDYYLAELNAYNDNGFANVVYYDSANNYVRNFMLLGKQVIAVPPGMTVKISVANSATIFKITDFVYRSFIDKSNFNLSEFNYQNWVDIDNSSSEATYTDNTKLMLKGIKLLQLKLHDSISGNLIRVNTFCTVPTTLSESYGYKLQLRDDSQSPFVYFNVDTVFSKENISVLKGQSQDGLIECVAIVDWTLLPVPFQFFGDNTIRLDSSKYHPIADIASDVYDLKLINNLTGFKKKILAIGTSITQDSNYVKNSCEKNNYLYYNKGIGSSGICLNTGILGTGRDGKDLSETIAEKEARYSGTVDSATMELYRGYSWERVIKPYLDGTIDDVDAIWFDHGYNDRNQIYAELATLDSVNWEPDNTSDRSTFSGAFKYLLWQIYNLKPTVKIIISGFIEGNSDNSIRGGAGIKLMHQSISDSFGFSFMKTFEHTGFSFNHVPNSDQYILDFNAQHGTSYTPLWTDVNGNITFFQLFLPDGVHPHTDLTGNANNVLDTVFINLLKGLV